MDNKQDGQIVLVLLLIIAVVLTIGLSIISRTVSDIKVTEQTQESSRAFWVAQAGLEEAIKLGAAPTGTLSNITYSVTKTGYADNKAVISLPDAQSRVKENETVKLWLIAHNSATGEIDPATYYQLDRVKVYWGNGDSYSAIPMPALEATVYYQNNLGDIEQIKTTLDPDVVRRATNGFMDANIGNVNKDGRDLSFNAEVLIPTGVPYLLTFRLYYNDRAENLAVETNDPAVAFPSQGNCFESVAHVAESGVTRRLAECRGWQTAAPIFENVIFSGINI